MDNERRWDVVEQFIIVRKDQEEQPGWDGCMKWERYEKKEESEEKGASKREKRRGLVNNQF